MRKDVEPEQLRSFGLLVGGVFAVIGLWPAVWRGEGVRLWTLGLALLLIIPALVLPRSLRWAYRGWMALGLALGWINTRLILGVVFYGLFTPWGLGMRLVGKDPMRRGFEPNADTYRVVRQPRSGAHMHRQF